MNPLRPSADALPATTKRVLASIPGGSAYEAVAERMQALGEGSTLGGGGCSPKGAKDPIIRGFGCG